MDLLTLETARPLFAATGDFAGAPGRDFRSAGPRIDRGTVERLDEPGKGSWLDS